MEIPTQTLTLALLRWLNQGCREPLTPRRVAENSAEIRKILVHLSPL